MSPSEPRSFGHTSPPGIALGCGERDISTTLRLWWELLGYLWKAVGHDHGERLEIGRRKNNWTGKNNHIEAECPSATQFFFLNNLVGPVFDGTWVSWTGLRCETQKYGCCWANKYKYKFFKSEQQFVWKNCHFWQLIKENERSQLKTVETLEKQVFTHCSIKLTGIWGVS